MDRRSSRPRVTSEAGSDTTRDPPTAKIWAVVRKRLEITSAEPSSVRLIRSNQNRVGKACRCPRRRAGSAGSGRWSQCSGGSAPELAGCSAAGSAVAGDVEGAGGVAQELVAVRARPKVAAGVEDGVGPGRSGLEPVMSPAERRDVAAAGRPAAVARDHVVTVAGAGSPGAPGEHAGVAGFHGLRPQLLGDLVGVGAVVVLEVDHRADHDRRPVTGAPASDLLRGDALTGVLDPAQPGETLRAGAWSGDRLVAEVDVQHHLSSRAPASR